MLLSHYTSEMGLIAIARSQSLWATEFLFLNDKTEFTYAMSVIYKKAMTHIFPQIPTDLRDQTKSDEYILSLVPDYINKLKEQTENGDGYGTLYVTSFARGRNEDENERGILTLWDRYTRNKGYCLQFDINNVRRLIDHENTRHSYAWIELAEVKYGIDENDAELKYLVEQMSLRMMERLFRETNDSRFLSDDDKTDPDSVFHRKLMSFCGKHKDPTYSDEREMRIFAYPLNVGQSQVFTGITIPKSIYRLANKATGRSYIVLGETVFPGLIPNGIIIGPKTQASQRMIDDLYPPPPIFRKSTIPIR